MKKITVEMLREHGAKCSQVDLFEEIFPDGAPVTMRSLKKARDAGLDVFFLQRLLTGPALTEYEKVRGRALTEYEKVRDAAWAEYEKVRGRALTEYEKVKGRAWAEYEKVEGRALVNALKESKHVG